MIIIYSCKNVKLIEIINFLYISAINTLPEKKTKINTCHGMLGAYTRQTQLRRQLRWAYNIRQTHLRVNLVLDVRKQNWLNDALFLLHITSFE
jgi:hypothetical protein